jgi:hypothetical protein
MTDEELRKRLNDIERAARDKGHALIIILLFIIANATKAC